MCDYLITEKNFFQKSVLYYNSVPKPLLSIKKKKL